MSVGRPFASRAFGGAWLSHSVTPSNDGIGESTFMRCGILARADLSLRVCIDSTATSRKPTWSRLSSPPTDVASDRDFRAGFKTFKQPRRGPQELRGREISQN